MNKYSVRNVLEMLYNHEVTVQEAEEMLKNIDKHKNSVDDILQTLRTKRGDER